jgi:hypothetical protein
MRPVANTIRDQWHQPGGTKLRRLRLARRAEVHRPPGARPCRAHRRTTRSDLPFVVVPQDQTTGGTRLGDRRARGVP